MNKLFYEPVHPHQAGTSVWLVKKYSKEDSERRLPRWKQWLQLRHNWMKQQEIIFGRHNLTCAICGKIGLHAFSDKRSLMATIDHILPVSKYPHLWNSPSNFQIACSNCNKKKADKC